MESASRRILKFHETSSNLKSVFGKFHKIWRYFLYIFHPMWDPNPPPGDFFVPINPWQGGRGGVPVGGGKLEGWNTHFGTEKQKIMPGPRSKKKIMQDKICLRHRKKIKRPTQNWTQISQTEWSSENRKRTHKDLHCLQKGRVVEQNQHHCHHHHCCWYDEYSNDYYDHSNFHCHCYCQIPKFTPLALFRKVY